MCRRLGWPPKETPNFSQHSRSCQSAPGYTGTHDCTRGAASSTSVLRVTPQFRLVDCTYANTWNLPAEPAAPKVISVGCTGAELSPPSPPSRGAGCQSIPATNE